MNRSMIPLCLLAFTATLSAEDKVPVRTVLPVKSSTPANFEPVSYTHLTLPTKRIV